MKHFDLGRHTRDISTRSTEAQRWFDLGLNWSFGFNHEEGVKCFEKALEADPGCVMAALSRQLYRARIESQGSPSVMPRRRHLATLR